MILLFSSHIIILSASPSNEIPICALCFLTANFIFSGNVDPQFLFIFNPLGFIPIAITLAPNDLNKSGPAL